VFDATERLVAQAAASDTAGPVTGLDFDQGGTLITDLLNSGWNALAGLLAPDPSPSETYDIAGQAAALVGTALRGNTAVETRTVPDGRTIFAVATPIRQGER